MAAGAAGSLATASQIRTRYAALQKPAWTRHALSPDGLGHQVRLGKAAIVAPPRPDDLLAPTRVEYPPVLPVFRLGDACRRPCRNCAVGRLYRGDHAGCSKTSPVAAILLVTYLGWVASHPVWISPSGNANAKAEGLGCSCRTL